VNNQYRGRFAPSPTGPLHFGSLVAALGSWLDAKANNGLWYLRIEDIDPPREQQNAKEDILRTLEAFGLTWDGDVFYQSQQLQHYQQTIEQLDTQERTYYCQCTRRLIRETAGIYQNTCRDLNLKASEQHSLRVRLDSTEYDQQKKQYVLHDRFQGDTLIPIEIAKEDFIIRRKDGLHAYMLAVVVDDIEQNISHVVRGHDLIETTAQQISLHKLLSNRAPRYAHMPMIVDSKRQKLSKQTHAKAISSASKKHLIIKALEMLNQEPPKSLKQEYYQDILEWAIIAWKPESFYGINEIVL